MDPGEAWGEFTMAAPATSWLRGEAAVVTLTVDGCDRQEIILAAGDEPVAYHRLLGRLLGGAHVLRIEMHPGLFSPVAQEVEVGGVRTVGRGRRSERARVAACPGHPLPGPRWPSR